MGIARSVRPADHSAQKSFNGSPGGRRLKSGANVSDGPLHISIEDLAEQ